LFWLTVREPVRSGTASEVPGLRAVFRQLGGKASYRNLLMAATVTAMVSYSVGQYLTSFLVRAHDLPIASAARYTGVALGLFGGIGTFGGGYLAEKLSKLGKPVLGLIPAAGLLIATPLYWVVFLTPSLPIAIIALMIGVTAHYLTVAPMYAITQGVAPPRSRATAVALLLLSLNLLGYGLGPPIVGAISDYLATWFTPAVAVGSINCSIDASSPTCILASGKGLRLSLALAACLQVWAAFHYWRCSVHLKNDWVD
jgi:MFS family permease